MRLEKRHRQSALALVLAPVGAVAVTMLVSALLVLWAGAPVAQTYALLLQGGFGSVFALSETFTRAIPLMLTGLAATVAFQARLFNIGAEGQLYAGALAAVAVGGLHGGTGFDQIPMPLLFALMMLAAALAGALLLLGPALLKARLGVDEVVTTLLLNFIVLLVVSMMLDGPMKDPTAMGWPQSVALMGELELSKLVPQTRVHTGLLWGLGLAVAVWALMRYTVPGFDIRAVGANVRAAQFAGVPVTRTVVLVAMLSGALAGLAGAIEVMAVHGSANAAVLAGYGTTGILVSFMARHQPLAIIPVAVMMGGIAAAGSLLQRRLDLPDATTMVLQGLLFIAILAGDAFLPKDRR
jgi:simple sugar transport system permease protein